MGRVLVVDYSNPAALSVLGEVDIPGTYQVVAVAVEGDEALVVARAGGTSAAGVNGELTLSVLDISNPQSPQLIGTTLVTDGLYASGAGLTKVSALPLGNGLFAVSEALVNGTPVLMLVDPSDPNNIVVTYTPVPALVNEMAVSGNVLYATSSEGLTLYNIGQFVTIPVTVSVEVPNNTGVAVVAGSYSTPPTQTIQGTSYDTLVWDLTLTFGDTQNTITWQSTVSDLGVGQVVPVTSSGSVGFVSQGTPGTVTLPGTAVTGVAIISISPESQTEQPGGTATYDVQLTNPTDAPITYYVNGQTTTGYAISDFNLNSNQPDVTVGPEATVDVPLAITSYSNASPGDNSFTVTASDSNNSNGASGSVQGNLTIAGQPIMQSNPNAYGVVAALTPSQASVGQGTSAQYVVQLTNTGSTDETFSLEADGLPDGVSYSFSQNDVDVPPGASNFRDDTLTLTVGPGITPGSYPFSVTATAKDNTSSATADGTLTVLANGVQVSLTLTSGSGAPGSTFQMTVINTGTVTETYNLTLAGPAALVASLTTTTVTLAPAQIKWFRSPPGR